MTEPMSDIENLRPKPKVSLHKVAVAAFGLLVGFVGRRYGLDSDVYSDVVQVGVVLGVYTIANKVQE